MPEICYRLEQDSIVTAQSEDYTSFRGGKPRLPDDMSLPVCLLCEAQQTFFFQVAFPADHPWARSSLGVFACTDCAHEDYTIPRMLNGSLHNARIPRGFLHAYQVNFRLLVFETAAARMRQDYVERVKFSAWELERTASHNLYTNKIGGQPAWVLGDEAPAVYNDATPMVFLMQLVQGVTFDIVENAPQQARLFEFPNAQPRTFYRLFNANALYFFGTHDRDNPLVYVITQCD